MPEEGRYALLLEVRDLLVYPMAYLVVRYWHD
jgi:hypothetical protein